MGRSEIHILALISLCILLALPGHAIAAKVDWLYNVDVAVVDQGAQQRGDAFQQALLVVLQRMTGLAEVPVNETVAAALRAPQEYYVEYAYREERSPPASAADQGSLQLVLAVRFAEAAIQRLVTQAGLPLWSSNRPTTVAWIAVSQNNERSVLGIDDPSPALAAVRARAAARGLPLVIPLMDLDEQLEVSAGIVWGGMVDVLELASERYAADDLLIGRVTQRDDGTWSADWELVQRGDVQHFDIDSPSAEAAGAAIVDRLSDDLVARYAVHSGDEQLLVVRIEGVGDVLDYGALLAYLGGLEFIDAVQVDTVQRNVVVVSLATRTAWERLGDLFALDGRLEPGLPALPGGPLQLTWRGDRPR